MDLVDEQDRAGDLLQFVDHALEALLEIAPVLGAGDERAHIQRVDRALAQHFRHPFLDDEPRQPLRHGGLADAGLAHVQGVVLAPSAQDLDRALDLGLPADQRVDPPVAGQLVEVGGELLERTGLRRVVLPVDPGARLVLPGNAVGHLRDPVGDVPDHVVAGDFLGFQQVNRLGLPLREDRHQHVRRRHLVLAAGLHVGDGAVKRPLESERRLRVGGFAVFAAQSRCRLVNEVTEFPPEPVDITPAGPQYPDNFRRIQQRQQQVFDGDELVLLVPSAPERLVQAEFEFAGKHQSSSSVHSSGCWLRCANAVTCATLVSAIS